MLLGVAYDFFYNIGTYLYILLNPLTIEATRWGNALVCDTVGEFYHCVTFAPISEILLKAGANVAGYVGVLF